MNNKYVQSFFASFTRYFDHWIHCEYQISPKSLALFRIAFVLGILFFKGSPNFIWLSQIPDYLYNPPEYSLGILFKGFPSYSLSFFLTLSIATAYIFLLFGCRTKVVGISLFFLMVLGNSLTFGFGKINHSGLLEMWTPLILAFSGWGNRYSIDEWAGRQTPNPAWPIALLALLIGFGMFTAGLPKYTSGWLNFSASNVQGYLYYHHYLQDCRHYLIESFLNFNYPLFWESLDYLTVLIELLFLAAILKRKVFNWFIFLAILFHTGVLLLLNVSFGGNLIVYIIFLDWKHLLRFFSQQKWLTFLRTRLKRVKIIPLFSFTLVAHTLFVVYRTLAFPEVRDNALNETINISNRHALVSIGDLVLQPFGTFFDLNILLFSLVLSLFILNFFIPFRTKKLGS